MSLVEYHDPDNLFPLLSPGLFARLPLRNLHWKSPSRPLRSISSLQVEFAPDQETQERQAQIDGTDGGELEIESKQPSQKSSLENATFSKAIENVSKSSNKRRKHQIPGLRQTPYLKIYLLKCDDSEAYKATSRKLLREWIKENARDNEGTTSKSKQENHDAFEWLILHVVLPDTPAAGQPRWSRASAGESEPKEKSSASTKWPGRGSGTILEKIRADFNQSGKSAPDRVAQIRLQKDAVPTGPQETSTLAIGSAYAESPQESAQAWTDLISKFKSQILMSFDLRVRQYEEDLREKEGQRSLPGWNFCTFFVHKEGLARAFESVGLIEDALVGYDELSAGLEAVIRNETSDATQSTTSFQLFTQDMYDQLVSSTRAPADTEKDSIDEESRSDSVVNTSSDSLINSSRKDYRTLILSNNISMFDFQCYVFSRQMSLLLRLANVRRSKPPNSGHSSSPSLNLTRGRDLGDGSENAEDVMSLAELCRRSPIFATTMTRVLRQDLLNGVSVASVDVKDETIDMLVSSWTFSVLQQMLDETSSSSLKAQTSHKSNTSQFQSRTDPHSGNRVSLPPRQYTYPLASGQVIYENEKFSQTEDIPRDVKPTAKAALGEVAGYRGDLFLLQRRHLEKIAGTYGWQLRAAEPANWDERVPLSPERAQSLLANLPSASDPKLREYLSSYEAFESAYSSLTSQAIHQYTIAGRKQSTNTLITDLAIMKYQDGDFATAANYFQSVVTTYSDNRWNSKEYSVLKKYAHCLKELHRKDEYVRMMLGMIAKSAAKEKLKIKKAGIRQSEQQIQREAVNWVDDAAVDDTDHLSELVTYSEQLPYDITVPMSKYFEDIEVDHHLHHFDDHDGFQLRVSFRPLIHDETRFSSLKLRLVESTADENRELWLENHDSIRLNHGKVKTWVSSNITNSGEYEMEKLTIQAGKLVFVHEIDSKLDAKKTLTLIASTSSHAITNKMAKVRVYPRNGAFQICLTPASRVHIGRIRSLTLKINCGMNEIERGKLQLRSGSAGLRLRTADAKLMGEQFAIEDQSKAGLITFGPMPINSSGELQIPYEVDRAMNEIVVRVEFSYSTSQGQFLFVLHQRINTELAIDVNVQEIFKDKVLVSKFFVRPTRAVPVHLLDAHLENSSTLEAEPLASSSSGFLIFPKQQACVTYKISRPSYIAHSSENFERLDKNLPLTIDYRSVLEDVINQLTASFSAALESTPHNRFSRLLLPEFRDRVRQEIALGDYERFALMGEIKVPSYEALKWSDALGGFVCSTKKELLVWLQTWHENHSIIALVTPRDENYMTISEIQRLVIDFEIPQMQYLHTVSLLPLGSRHRRAGGSSIASVGEAIAMEVRIRHTRRWDMPADKERFVDGVQHFIYEIQANPEVWIVGGQQRERFSAQEDELLVFEKVLVPVKTGHLLVPAIEIKPVESDAHMDGASIRPPTSCETDCTSQCEVILVIEDSSSVTVGFGQEGHIARGVSVLESEARGQAQHTMHL